jgi:hypothetical protein
MNESCETIGKAPEVICFIFVGSYYDIVGKKMLATICLKIRKFKAGNSHAFFL